MLAVFDSSTFSVHKKSLSLLINLAEYFDPRASHSLFTPVPTSDLEGFEAAQQDDASSRLFPPLLLLLILGHQHLFLPRRGLLRALLALLARHHRDLLDRVPAHLPWSQSKVSLLRYFAQLLLLAMFDRSIACQVCPRPATP